MRSGPTSRWPRLFVLGVAVAFVVNALQIYGTKLAPSIHSDNAIGILVAAKTLASGSPILRDWYYTNGEVWVFGPQLYALIPVALWGVGTKTLFATILVGFVLEILLLYWSYGALSRDVTARVLATCLTLLAWSRMHLLFVYLDLAYGYYATLFAFVFALLAHAVARRLEGGRTTRLLAAALALTTLASLQQPIRGLVFLVGPLLACFAWPFRGVPVRLRAVFGGGVLACWAASYLVYRFLLVQTLLFSIPSGHNAFAFRDPSGILSNAKLLAEGFLGLVGNGGGHWSTLPGLLILGVAAVLVTREVFASRDWSALRFVCIATLVQLVLVAGPLVTGNLVINDGSIRYLMPSFLIILGLGALIAMRNLAAQAPLSRRRGAAAATLVALAPVAAVLAIVHVRPVENLEGNGGQWAHRRAHADLARALTDRGLRHGFSTYWNANLTTLLSNGIAKTCSVHFTGGGLLPYRWHTDTECFDAARLPDRVFVLNRMDEREIAAPALRAMPEPLEQFAVGAEFDVRVYRTSNMPLEWMQLPLPEADQLRFPLRLQATHPLLRRGHATVSGESVVGDGEAGAILFGPYDLALPKGRYRVRWMGSGVPSPGSLHFDVAAGGGAATLAASDHPSERFLAIAHAELTTLAFALSRPTSGFEFRIFSVDGGKVALDALVLERECDHEGR